MIQFSTGLPMLPLASSVPHLSKYSIFAGLVASPPPRISQQANSFWRPTLNTDCYRRLECNPVQKIMRAKYESVKSDFMPEDKNMPHWVSEVFLMYSCGVVDKQVAQGDPSSCSVPRTANLLVRKCE